MFHYCFEIFKISTKNTKIIKTTTLNNISESL